MQQHGYFDSFVLGSAETISQVSKELRVDFIVIRIKCIWLSCLAVITIQTNGLHFVVGIQLGL